MKAMLYLAALLPLSVMAQQQNNLKQGIQSQSRAQQQHLQTQLNNDRQRVQQNNNLTREQPLPNTNGGMLQRQTTP